MNEYIFYSAEGETLAPNIDVVIENCQVLGSTRASDIKHARKFLQQENPWINGAGFDMAKTITKQVLTEEQKADIMTIVDYLWVDEKKHYEELNQSQDHIFSIIKRLKAMCK